MGKYEKWEIESAWAQRMYNIKQIFDSDEVNPIYREPKIIEANP